ncbi:putative NAD-dependent deacytelase Sir2 [Monocercomonoides exilis]|uniref:putative NAD-dependent deacytelase Sir2 n=1 Tax=Monocercomonoides exilis TaxID=2049356 RepID=UPI003559F7CA|nr:putative NAD-dependent deacytelase Sir2 [Monocercomonoides exilis]|eukprot:MONOS_5798.1-p1 / transcript=MONOS_5798.1 / gene=MONOS_5798 / organism=Monocercomonoides_exilis_PA203 / gene_product=NAD / transcript_product=NAD / location=Mono_scaffold00173:97234-100949(-) / protein_length=1007 / sequence_SO=supercontig / SO=protein_coding / is_pseudo=false
MEASERLKNRTEAYLKSLAHSIRTGAAVVFVTGAGLSVASGIAPYRGTKNAIWSKFVLDWGTRKKFKKNPAKWWNEFWLRTHESLQFLSAKPNNGHHALSQISKISNAKIITQNIDRLHHKTAFIPQHIVEIHGRLGYYRCTGSNCVNGKDSYVDYVDFSRLALDGTSMEAGNLRIQPPLCPRCSEYLMPLSLFFDETYCSHSYYNWETAARWMVDCDIMVFVGTSFSVGITQTALEIAMAYQKQVYSFNLFEEEIDVTFPLQNLYHVVGKAEFTLPQLHRYIMHPLTLYAVTPSLYRSASAFLATTPDAVVNLRVKGRQLKVFKKEYENVTKAIEEREEREEERRNGRRSRALKCEGKHRQCKSEERNENERGRIQRWSEMEDGRSTCIANSDGKRSFSASPEHIYSSSTFPNSNQTNPNPDSTSPSSSADADQGRGKEKLREAEIDESVTEPERKPPKEVIAQVPMFGVAPTLKGGCVCGCLVHPPLHLASSVYHRWRHEHRQYQMMKETRDTLMGQYEEDSCSDSESDGEYGKNSQGNKEGKSIEGSKETEGTITAACSSSFPSSTENSASASASPSTSASLSASSCTSSSFCSTKMEVEKSMPEDFCSKMDSAKRYERIGVPLTDGFTNENMDWVKNQFPPKDKVPFSVKNGVFRWKKKEELEKCTFEEYVTQKVEEKLNKFDMYQMELNMKKGNSMEDDGEMQKEENSMDIEPKDDNVKNSVYFEEWMEPLIHMDEEDPRFEAAIYEAVMKDVEEEKKRRKGQSWMEEEDCGKEEGADEGICEPDDGEWAEECRWNPFNPTAWDLIDPNAPEYKAVHRARQLQLQEQEQKERQKEEQEQEQKQKQFACSFEEPDPLSAFPFNGPPELPSIVGTLGHPRIIPNVDRAVLSTTPLLRPRMYFTESRHFARSSYCTNRDRLVFPLLAPGMSPMINTIKPSFFTRSTRTAQGRAHGKTGNRKDAQGKKERPTRADPMKLKSKTERSISAAIVKTFIATGAVPGQAQ